MQPDDELPCIDLHIISLMLVCAVDLTAEIHHIPRQFGSLCGQVGPQDHVICALSGGVDSTVAAVLVHKVLGDRLHCVFVDNGLLRFKVCSRSYPEFFHCWISM